MSEFIPADVKTSAEARGKRLKSVRKMADLSRKALAIKHKISASTMQAWEEGKAGGLTNKGAQRIIAALREEGVYCTLEWLMYGSGQSPYITESLFLGTIEANTDYPQAIVMEADIKYRELLIFRQLNHDVADIIINDDGMYPFYQLGDIVAGRRYYGEQLNNLIGKDCIVETATSEILFRRLRQGKTAGHYNLQCVYLDTLLEEPVRYEVSLISAAPIIWHRRA